MRVLEELLPNAGSLVIGSSLGGQRGLWAVGVGSFPWTVWTAWDVHGWITVTL